MPRERLTVKKMYDRLDRIDALASAIEKPPFALLEFFLGVFFGILVVGIVSIWR